MALHGLSTELPRGSGLRERARIALALLGTALVGAAALLAAGCGGDEEQSLTIYSGRSEELIGPLLERFTEDTGISVGVRYGSTAQLAALLAEEGDQSPADIFISQDAGALGAVQAAGLFTDIDDYILERVAPAYRSREGQWVGLSGRARVVVYNTDALDASDLPQSILEFTEPEWRGRVAWAPTNGSFQAWVTALRVGEGEDGARAWLEGMRANDAPEFPGNSAIVEAVGRGEVDAGLVNHYYVHRFKQEHGQNAAVENYHLPEKGPGNLAMISGAGVLETARNEANAHAFLRYLLSAQAQAYFAHQTFEYPMVQAIPIHEALTPLAEIQTPEANMDDLLDLQATLSLLRELGVVP